MDPVDDPALKEGDPVTAVFTESGIMPGKYEELK